MTDFVKLYPEDFPETVKILIALADRADDVATDTDAGFGLRIPTYLHDRYQAYLGLEDDLSTPDAGNVEKAAPKRRGRPRKIRPGEEE
jgi:hypothetical protein